MNKKINDFLKYIIHFEFSFRNVNELKSTIQNLKEEVRIREGKFEQLRSSNIRFQNIGILYNYFLNIQSYLTVYDVLNSKKIRLGEQFDGGYVLLDSFSNIDAAYSFGISNDVSWDLEMANREINVFMYDHTIEKLPIENEYFHFNKIGIADYSVDNMMSIEDILMSNNHIDENNLMLKMDIEGWEWVSLTATPQNIIEKFDQIVIELHGLNDLIDIPMKLSVLEKLNRTHQVIHVHGNNNSTLTQLFDCQVPDVLEVTYIRRKDREFKICESMDSSLDNPNNTNHLDFDLTNWNHKQVRENKE